ncbi:hypothetical protein FACS1894211_01970 [Clostridia bacterium]|nr:hypothetical protein FACS1894211_01970 [Clostridia bacterium]
MKIKKKPLFKVLVVALTALFLTPFLAACGDGGKAAAVKPGITGPTVITLTEGYEAVSTGAYTVTGDEVTVKKTSGNGLVTWNDETKKLDIKAGLAAGSYPIVLTATNGNIDENAVLTFTITVDKKPAIKPGLEGQTTLALVEGYTAVSTEAYVVTGDDVGVEKTSGNALITWNDTAKTLDIAAGLLAGSYPIVLTATNGNALEDVTLTFTVTVTEAPIMPDITATEDFVMLISDYEAQSFNYFTVSGTSVTVSAVSDPVTDKITWNAATNKLDIAEGLAKGAYAVTVKATNGTVEEDSSVVFTVYVTELGTGRLSSFDNAGYIDTVKAWSDDTVNSLAADGAGIEWLGSGADANSLKITAKNTGAAVRHFYYRIYLARPVLRTENAITVTARLDTANGVHVFGGRGAFGTPFNGSTNLADIGSFPTTWTTAEYNANNMDALKNGEGYIEYVNLIVVNVPAGQTRSLYIKDIGFEGNPYSSFAPYLDSTLTVSGGVVAAFDKAAYTNNIYAMDSFTYNSLNADGTTGITFDGGEDGNAGAVKITAKNTTSGNRHAQIRIYLAKPVPRADITALTLRAKFSANSNIHTGNWPAFNTASTTSTGWINPWGTAYASNNVPTDILDVLAAENDGLVRYINIQVVNLTPNETRTVYISGISCTYLTSSLSGPSSIALDMNYSAAAKTGAFAVTNPRGVVSLTCVEDTTGKITWNDSDKTIGIAAGLANGTYNVEVTVPGIAGILTHNFTVTVGLPGLQYTGSTEIFTAEPSDITGFTVIGGSDIEVTIISAEDTATKLTWDDTNKKIAVASDIAPGTYNITLTASNGSSESDATLNITLHILPAGFADWLNFGSDGTVNSVNALGATSGYEGTPRTNTTVSLVQNAPSDGGNTNAVKAVAVSDGSENGRSPVKFSLPEPIYRAEVVSITIRIYAIGLRAGQEGLFILPDYKGRFGLFDTLSQAGGNAVSRPTITQNAWIDLVISAPQLINFLAKDGYIGGFTLMFGVPNNTTVTVYVSDISVDRRELPAPLVGNGFSLQDISASRTWSNAAAASTTTITAVDDAPDDNGSTDAYKITSVGHPSDGSRGVVRVVFDAPIARADITSFTLRLYGSGLQNGQDALTILPEQLADNFFDLATQANGGRNPLANNTWTSIMLSETVLNYLAKDGLISSFILMTGIAGGTTGTLYLSGINIT